MLRYAHPSREPTCLPHFRIFLGLSMQKNDNDRTQLFNNYAEIVGSGIGGVLGFLAGDPMAAAFGSVGGSVAAMILKNIGQEFSKRQLAPREDFRVGKVLAIAASEIHQRLENGERLRNDGFFDRQPSGRSDAEEIAESIMLKCQREPQEKKIEYIGYLLSGIAFDSNLSPDMGHQLIKAAEELTYRQFCILKLAVVKDNFGLRGEDYRGQGTFATELSQVLYECLDLYHRAYINLGGEVAFGPTDVKPGSMTVQGIGGDLFNLMKLSAIPDQDITPIAEVLK